MKDERNTHSILHKDKKEVYPYVSHLSQNEAFAQKISYSKMTSIKPFIKKKVQK